MKFNRCIAIIAAVFLIAVSGLATADILPREVPENQVFTLSSIIEAVGAVTESTSLVWQIGDQGLTALPPARGTDTFAIRSGSIGYMTYSDSIMTNGGQISEVKSFSMDTHEKENGLFNIETAKVLTYTSQNGSHLMGEESFVLDVAGNWSAGMDDIVCVFARAAKDVIPAFCNKVTASSKLNQVTTAQIETVGSMTGVGAKANVPAALKYEISVTPDANSASGYADGIFSTTFTVSIMEGRSDGAITGPSAGQVTVPVVVGRDPISGENIIAYDVYGFIPGGVVGLTDANGVYAPAGRPGEPLVTSVQLTATAAALNAPGGVANVGCGGFIYPNIAALATGTVARWGCVPRMTTEWRQTAGESTYDSYRGMPVVPGAPYSLANYEQLASTLTYIDSATVAGGVSTFNKAFSYQSGIYCDKCNL